MRILSWNINGINDKLKDKEIQNMLFKKNDIIILSETHEYKNIKVNYNIPGFEYFPFARSFVHKKAPWPSGGIGIFVRMDLLNGIEKPYSHDESIVWLRLKSSFFGWNEDVLIASVYFSPANSTYVNNANICTDYFNILNDEICKHKGKGKIYICGDFNARIGQKQDYCLAIPGNDGHLSHLTENNIPEIDHSIVSFRKSKDFGENEYCQDLLDFCRGSGFIIMNGRLYKDKNIGKFTYYHANGGCSTIDYLLSQARDMDEICDFEILDKNVVSDHCPVTFKLSVNRYFNNLLQDKNEKQMFKVYKFDQSKCQNYINKLESDECNVIYNEMLQQVADSKADAETVCKLLYDFLYTAIDGNFDVKRSKKKSKFPKNKWYDSECKQARNLADEYAKNYDISKTPHNENYKLLQQEYKRITQYKRRLHENGLKSKLENMHSTNPNDFWKLWNSLKTYCINNSTLTIEDQNKYYKSQIDPPDVEYFDNEHMREIEDFVNKYFNDSHDQYINDLDFDICNAPITIEESKLHIIKLKNNKAAGIDGIASEFLKVAVEQLLHPLTLVFNFMFEYGEFPKIWCEGIINPTHKKGSQNVADNFRKITVMSVLGKVFESIMNDRLKFRNISLDLNDDCQFGFKNNCRTTDNIFILNSLIEKQNFKKKPLYVCFVDFTKAFDYVHRGALYYKLIKRGVNGKLLKIICSMYDNAKCRVKWKGDLGKEFDSKFGVLQGGMASPFLFSEFLTDLKDYLHKNYGTVLGNRIINYLLFADDLIICSENANDLQKLIDGLFEFCKKWHLIVSMTKTKIVVFNKKQVTDEFTYNGENIEIVSQYKYVGTIFSSDKKDHFSHNSEHLADKAQKALFAMNYHILKNVKYITPSLAIKMFDVHIMPILQYGAEIWAKCKPIDCMEKMYLKYLKYHFKVKRSTCTAALYSETGTFPLHIRHKFQMIKYWHRLLSLPDSHILKSVYNGMYDLHEMGNINWCSKIKTILTEVDMIDVWEKQNMDSKTLATVKEKLYKSFMDKIMFDIAENFPKLRTFKKFKGEYKLENYISELHDDRYIKAIFRFRVSSHNLRIETGRYERNFDEKLPAELRLCKICNENAVEDEKHFLLECEEFQIERNRMLEIINRYIDTDSYRSEKFFCDIMICKNIEVMKALGSYLFNCFKRRNELLNCISH